MNWLDWIKKKVLNLRRLFIKGKGAIVPNVLNSLNLVFKRTSAKRASKSAYGECMKVREIVAKARKEGDYDDAELDKIYKKLATKRDEYGKKFEEECFQEWFEAERYIEDALEDIEQISADLSSG